MLELAIAGALYDLLPDADEGRLAKIRSFVVSRQSCAAVARRLGLVDGLLEHARAVPEAELKRISLSRNVMAALFESAIAGVYLARGFEVAREAIVEAFAEEIAFALAGHVDNKTDLQEALARTGRQVAYIVVEMDGPPHERRFVCAAEIAGERVGLGRGTSKKAAEQEAAAEALHALGLYDTLA